MHPIQTGLERLFSCIRCVIRVRKIIAFIFMRPGMKAAEVLFNRDTQGYALSNRLGLLNPDLVCVCPRSYQIIRQRYANLAIGTPSSNFSAS